MFTLNERLKHIVYSPSTSMTEARTHDRVFTVVDRELIRIDVDIAQRTIRMILDANRS